jgi:tRNA(Ile)-lysidine synthase TilS/MesJ
MCKQCEINPVYEFTNKRKLCSSCFVKYFQKKVFYTIRKFKMAHSGDIIGYKNNETFRDVVLEDVLKMFAEKANAKLIKSLKSDKIALSTTLDLEADKITHKLMDKNSKMKFSPFEGRTIKPLYLFLDEEILLYAKIKKLKFKKIKKEKDKLSSFIDELEEKHPEIKRAIVNSMLKMENLK